MEKKKVERKKNVEDFQLPAGYRKNELRKKAGFYRSGEVQVERLGNAQAVYRILEEAPRALEKHGERSFQECIEELIRLSLQDDPLSFFQKYDEFRKNRVFLVKLQEYLRGKKLGLSLDENELLGTDAEATVWSVVGCEDIVLNPEDPAVRIREDSTGREFTLFLIDLFGRLIDS